MIPAPGNYGSSRPGADTGSRRVGPQIIQIGNEGGLLPAPAVLNHLSNVLGQNPNLIPSMSTIRRTADR